MGMMEVTINNVVKVISVGDARVPAARAVGVSHRVSLASVARGTGGRVRLGVREGVVLVGPSGGAVMQVAIMKEIHVAIVGDLGVSAASPVEMFVAMVNGENNRNGSVVIAVVAMEMVEVAINDEINMISVGDARVATGRAMLVAGGILLDASGGVHSRDGDGVLVNVEIVGAVEVTIVEETKVAIVGDLGVPTARLVDMGAVVGVLGTDLVDLAVMVAVALVDVVEMPANEVVNMISMGDLLVATGVSVDVASLVTLARVAGGASGGFVRKSVLVDVISVGAVKAASVKEAHVVVMLDALVAAAVGVGVAVVIAVVDDALAVRGHDRGRQSGRSRRKEFRGKRKCGRKGVGKKFK